MPLQVHRVFHIRDGTLIAEDPWPERTRFRQGDVVGVLMNLHPTVDSVGPRWKLRIKLGPGLEARQLEVPLDPFVTEAVYKLSTQKPVSIYRIAPLAFTETLEFDWLWLFRDAIYVTESFPSQSELEELVTRIKALHLQRDSEIEPTQEQFAQSEVADQMTPNRKQAPTPEQFGLSTHDVEAMEPLSLDMELVLKVSAWISVIVIVVMIVVRPNFWLVRYPAAFWPMLMICVLSATGSAVLAAALLHRWFRYRDTRLVDPVALSNYRDACVEFAKREHEAREADYLVRREERRRLRQQESWWKALDGRRFERELARHLRERGCEVRHTGGSGDGGIDLEVRHSGKRILVQCKAHARYLSSGAVRDLYGTLMHEGADEAWLVATSGFYGGARSFAYGKPVRLLTIGQLLAAKSFPPPDA